MSCLVIVYVYTLWPSKVVPRSVTECRLFFNFLSMSLTLAKYWIICCIFLGSFLYDNRAWADDAFASDSFRVGFYARAFPDFSLADLETTVKLLSEEIGKKIGLQTSVTVFTDLAEMRKAFEHGEINFVVASSLNLANEFENSQFSDGFRMVTSNDFNDTLVVMTQKNAGLDTFKSLAGKRLTLVENDPIAHLYIDTLALSNFKKHYHDSFKVVKNEKKYMQTILKLFFGQTDVICVYQNAYAVASELNPQIVDKLQIVSQINGIPQGLGFFHVSTPPLFREKVIAELLKLDANARGRELLQLFKADKTIRTSPADLIPVKQLAASLSKVKAQ